ncbi:right-handed parallel beta-helix repeat-containing protein, partial [bacterium]|nr:right-handed parallel beta-helix repeat-containing protein [bacterium]
HCIVCVLLLLTATLSYGVSVTGVALLENETDHSGIEVKFEAVSPSAETDSVYTDSLGIFLSEIELGVYNVHFSKINYGTLVMDTIAFIQDTTLATVTLTNTESDLSGSLNDTIAPGLYRVTGDIFVDASDTLVILPGARFEFISPFGLAIYGHLNAEGTPDDSIIFSSLYEDARWSGIVFHPNTIAIISYVFISNVSVRGEAGGGVTCLNSNAEFSHCSFVSNYAEIAGGGMYVRGGTLQIVDCVFSDNICDYLGGGLCSDLSCTLEISHCEFLHNQAGSGGGITIGSGTTVFMNQCMIFQNDADGGGGGIYSRHSTSGGLIEYCTISENTASGGGGGLYADGPQSISMRKCSIIGNQSSCYVGGCLLADSDIHMDCCKITGCQSWIEGPNSIYIGGGAPTLQNCTIVGSNTRFYGEVKLEFTSALLTNTIIRNQGIGVYFDDSPHTTIEHCDIFSINGQSLAFEDDDPAHGPVILGNIFVTNANGDSCDTYYNIFEDPLFIDAENDNYHLQEGSPCIDAGDPNLPYDPDGTIADIGAYYFPQTQAINDPLSSLPTELILHQNYPNPFNATTRISFTLPETGNVRLDLFDIRGRQVAELLHRSLVAGEHTVSLDGKTFASGVYFCRLQFNGQSLTRKMILMK